MGYHEDLFKVFKVADPKGYRNLRKTTKRRDSVLLDSGHYSTQAWGALNKCWRGYKIAKSEMDMQKMFHYAKGIRKFQRELGIKIMDFPHFGLVGRLVEQEREQYDNFIAGSDGRQQDPVRITERELDPRNELDEYLDSMTADVPDEDFQHDRFLGTGEQSSEKDASGAHPMFRERAVDIRNVFEKHDQKLQELQMLLAKYAQFQDQNPHLILEWARKNPRFLDMKLDQLRSMDQILHRGR